MYEINKKSMIRLISCSFCVLIFCFSTAWAGNREMVEQRTKELDEMNKQAVSQISDLPKDGTVEIKAKAKYKEGSIQFDIYEKKVSDAEEGIIKTDKGKGPDNGSVKEETIYINNPKDTSTNGEKQENGPENN